MDAEKSPGGSELYRHEARTEAGELRPWERDEAMVEAIEAHFDRCFGADSGRTVFHEIVSDLIHLDVHHFPPSPEFPFQRLITAGMSTYPMTVPEGFDETPYAELTIALPAEWTLTAEAGAVDLEMPDTAHWPMRLLKFLGRLPHEHSTFLWYGHTIPNQQPPEPYASDTSLCGAAIVPPLLVPDGFHDAKLADGRSVRFLAVLPLYEDEMAFKLAKGFDALLDRLGSARVDDIVDQARPSAVARRGLFRR